MGDAVAGAELVEPVRPPAARGHNGLLGVDLKLRLPLGQPGPQAGPVLQKQVVAGAAKADLHPVLQKVALDGAVDLLGLLCAQVADGAVHQLQACLDGPLADLLDGLLLPHALHAGVGAELQVDGVCVLNQALRLLLPDELGQVASHLGGEGQLPVGEGPRPGEPGGDVAVGLAAHATAGGGFGAAALLDGLALLHQQDLPLAPLAQQLHGGKDPRRPGSDNQHVCVHVIHPFK